MASEGNIFRFDSSRVKDNDNMAGFCWLVCHLYCTNQKPKWVNEISGPKQTYWSYSDLTPIPGYTPALNYCLYVHVLYTKFWSLQGCGCKVSRSTNFFIWYRGVQLQLPEETVTYFSFAALVHISAVDASLKRRMCLFFLHQEWLLEKCRVDTQVYWNRLARLN